MKICRSELPFMTLRTMHFVVGLFWIIGLALVGSQQVLAASSSESDNSPAPDGLFSASPEQPQPSTQPVLGLAVAGESVVGVGLRGLIVKSADQDETWRQIPSPVSTDLVAVHFGSAMNGWAVGHDSVLLQTKDGGESWTINLDGRRLKKLLTDYYDSAETLDEFERENMLAEIDFATTTSADPDVIPTPFLNVNINANGEGFVLGAFGMLLHTDDNGESWVPWIERTDNERRMHLYGISSNASDVYISGEQGLLMKLDKSQNRFVEVNLPYPGTIFGVSVHNQLILAYGLRGNLFASRDQGESWQQIDSGQKGSLVDAVRLDESHSLLVSQRGELVRLNENTLKTEKVNIGLAGNVFSSVLFQPGDVLIFAQFGGAKAFGINKVQ